jgi:hypothetical protein
MARVDHANCDESVGEVAGLGFAAASGGPARKSCYKNDAQR